VLVAQGNLPEALKSYRDGLAIRDRLAKADAGNAGWQRDLSVVHNKIGDRAGCAGQSAGGAEELPRRSRHQDAAKADAGHAGWQRDLSVSYNKISDVLVAQGNLPEALKSFRDGLAIASVWRRRTRATPAGSAICRCPTTRSATCWFAGQSAGGAEDFRDGSPSETVWRSGRGQRRLAARSVGVLQQYRRRAGCAGQSAEALKSFRDGLAIAERLAKADAGNAGWQRDLSVSYRTWRIYSDGLRQSKSARRPEPRPRDHPTDDGSFT